MTGVVFIICVPSEKKENELANRKCPKISHQSNGFLKHEPEKYTERTGLLNNKSNLNEYLNGIDSKIAKDKPETMKMIVGDVLSELQIENSVWSNTENGNYVQIIFTMESGENCEKILNVLKENGIGSKYNSIVSVSPCSFYYKASKEKTETPQDDDDKEKNSMWTQFVLSVRARPTVAQVVENIKSHAELTFNFVCLLIIATTLCAIGLVENSNIYLLSSMLISPMMGPVMAATFGTVIRDKTLQKIGIRSEMLGLGIALAVGYCYGATICLITDKYGEGDWPTSEMITRGQLRTLGVGCLIAILSGAALALGLLSDNVASLVGVAISTSLMPPAVNAGLLWSIASIYYLKGNETTTSEYRGTEIACLGFMSLCLTFINIVCIYIAGIIVFKIKEVAPIASRDHMKRHFWKHDVKISRDYNKRKCFHRSIDFSQSHEHIDRGIITRHEYTWSPSTDFAIRPSVKELQEFYFKQFINETCDNCSQVRRNSNGYSTFRGGANACAPSNNEEINNESSKVQISKRPKFVVTPSDESISVNF